MTLRERCEKFSDDLRDIHNEHVNIHALESFVRSIRNESLEEASYIAVNSSGFVHEPTIYNISQRILALKEEV